MDNEEVASGPNEKAVDKWQTRLLPFMTKTLVALALFFFTISMVQLYYLQKNMLNNPKINVAEPLAQLSQDSDHSHKAVMEDQRLKSMVLLEAGSVQNQFYQANLLLMSRVWITYIGFVTGMIMAVVGCVFILGKLSTSITSVSAQVASHNVSINSTSPGLILAFLGTCLMTSALFVNHTISSRYNAIYIRDNALDGNSYIMDSVPHLRSDTNIFKNQ